MPQAPNSNAEKPTNTIVIYSRPHPGHPCSAGTSVGRRSPLAGDIPATQDTPHVNDELRFRVLRLLTQRPEISQRELAGQLGMSLGKANFCVRALIEKGWIKAENFRNSRNKRAYVYALTPNGLRAKARVTVDFLRRKQAEYAQLEHEIEELRLEAAKLTDTPVTDREIARR